jgi:UDP-N-acetylmuramate dehydrogenase
MPQSESLHAWCRERKISFLVNEPLDRHVWLGIGGPADIMLFPEMHQIAELAARLHEGSIPYSVLGKGSNVLVSDAGVRGAVISLDRLSGFSVDTELHVIHAEAGVALQQLVRCAAEHGFGGIEGLAGIPGTIAGAVAGNAGSFGAEIKDVLLRAEVVLSNGEARMLSCPELQFSYRHAVLPSGGVISCVVLQFQPADPEELRIRVQRFRAEKREHQPVSERSAGCVFRNPPGDAAGRLIDAAVCKGLQQGGIMVSPVHANFFVNIGGGTARDYLLLMEQVQQRVFAHSGVQLSPEIRTIGL